LSSILGYDDLLNSMGIGLLLILFTLIERYHRSFVGVRENGSTVCIFWVWKLRIFCIIRVHERAQRISLS